MHFKRKERKMKNTTPVCEKQRTPLKKNIFYRAAKRVMDTVCSAIGLVLLSPLFIVIMILIVAEDGSPAIYKQKRIGKGGREFSIYKFRSMYKDADKIHEKMKADMGVTEVSFKLSDSEDPRITRIGRFIRKTNIDELPQLWNILCGQMSIVGPRPLAVYEYEDEQKMYEGRFDERYDVPQGLTCYWQAQFSKRGDIDFNDRMQMDVDYARDANLWIDIKLIFSTAIHIIAGKAGYS